MVTVYTVQTGPRVRLQTLNKDEAVKTAQRIYRDEDVIPDIVEEFRESTATSTPRLHVI